MFNKGNMITQLPQVTLTRPLRNERTPITVSPNFPPDNPKSLIQRSLEGASGQYRVQLILSSPGLFPLFFENIDLSSLCLMGDSVLAPPQGYSHIHVTIGNFFGEKDPMIVTFETNDKGRLGRAILVVKANSFFEARYYAYTYVLPVLSCWSVIYDVAIEIAFDDIEEIATETKSWSVGFVGRVNYMSPSQELAIKQEYRIIFSSYREGLCSLNPFYRALCFSKCIEGIRRSRVSRKRQSQPRGQRSAITLDNVVVERFPAADSLGQDETAHVRRILIQHSGELFISVINKLKPAVRDAVAHLDPSKGTSLNADDYKDIVNAENSVVLLRYMAKRLIEEELKKDPVSLTMSP